MRRTLAWICIALVTIAFILLSLVLILKIDVIIPILLFVVAFIMFLMIKRMPTDEQRKQDMETHEHAFFDTEEALGVFGGDIPRLVGGEAPYLRDLRRDEGDIAAVVAPSAIGLGCHVGAIRFDQNAFERQRLHRFDGSACVFEGDNTRSLLSKCV